MEFLSEADHQKLYPLLLLEVTALFDSCGLSFRKRKPSKRKRKEGRTQQIKKPNNDIVEFNSDCFCVLTFCSVLFFRG